MTAQFKDTLENFWHKMKEAIIIQVSENRELKWQVIAIYLSRYLEVKIQCVILNTQECIIAFAAWFAYVE